MSPSLNGEESLKINKLSDLDSDLDPHQDLIKFVPVTHATCPLSFVHISAQLLKISCLQTDKQTGVKTLNFHPLSVVEITRDDVTFAAADRSQSAIVMRNCILYKIMLHHTDYLANTHHLQNKG